MSVPVADAQTVEDRGLYGSNEMLAAAPKHDETVHAEADFFALKASIVDLSTGAISPLQSVPTGSPLDLDPGILFEPGNVEVRANGLSISGTGTGFINHPSVAAEPLKVRYSTDFTISREPFRVVTGEARFLQGTEEVAYLDRNGLRVPEADEPPPPMIADATCEMDLPVDQSPVSREARAFVDQQVSLGGFPLTIISAEGSAEALNGTGSIDVPHMEAPLSVAFSGLAINAANEAYAGTATATQDKDASEIGADMLTNYDQTTADELAASHLRDIYAAVSQGRRADQLSGTNPVGLPYGVVPASGQSANLVIAVAGVRFTPTGSVARALMTIPMPTYNNDLGFGADDVCITHDGFGGLATFSLPSDRRFQGGGGVVHRFKGSKDNDGSAKGEGTRVTWENGDVGEIHVALDVEYPREWLTPVDAQGNRTTGASVASFAFTRTPDEGLTDWIAEGTLQRSEIASVPDFVLSDAIVMYDMSAAKNIPDMSYPDGYKGLQSVIWTGLYIPEADLRFPSVFRTLEQPNERVNTTVKGILIDNQGPSFQYSVDDVFAETFGDLGGWGYRIASFNATVLNNSLTEGSFEGDVRVPLFESDISYEATYARAAAHQELEYTFFLETSDKAYDSGLWNSGITLDDGSIISIDVEGDEFTASATLHGELDLMHKARGGGLIKYSGQSLNLPPLKFQDLIVRSQGPDYVEPGVWEHASTRANLGGFPLRVDNINVVSRVNEGGAATSLGLVFSEVSLVLPGVGPKKKGTSKDDAFGKETTQVFRAVTGFTLWSKISVPEGEQVPVATFDTLQLDQIQVKGGIEKAFKIAGKILFFNPESPGVLGEYGEGGAGSLEITIMRLIDARAEVIFGTKYFEDEGDVKYWLAGLEVSIPTGIALGSSGVGIYGFKGGAYRHMDSPDEWTQNGMNYSPSRVQAEEGQAAAPFSDQDANTNYTVDPNVAFGLQAGVILGTVPTPNILTADVNLEMSFTTSGGLNKITIGGRAFAMHGGKLNDPTTREETAQLVIDEFSLVGNPPEETFIGTFAATFEPGPPTASVGGLSAVKATGEAKLYTNNKDKKYFFQIGEPLGDRMQLQYLGGLITGEAYLYSGTQAPSRVAPPDSYCNTYLDITGEQSPLCRSAYGPQPPDSRFGFLLGASINANFGGRFTIFYATIAADAGFDLNLMNVGQAVCTSTGKTPGASGFYATGQMYAALRGDIGVIIDLFVYQGRFSILDVGVAAELQGGLPNPFWARGAVAGSYRVLNGLVEGNFDYQFSAGEVCELGAGQALAQFEAVGDIQPHEGMQDASIFTDVSAAYTIPLDEKHQFEDAEGNTQTVRVRSGGMTLHLGETTDGAAIPASISKQEGGKLLVLRPNDPLVEQTSYTVSVTVYAEEWDAENERWIKEEESRTRTATFTTGDRPKKILGRHVARTYPGNRWRNVIPGASQHRLGFNRGDGIDYSFLQEPSEEEQTNGVTSVDLRVRYTPLNHDGQVQEVTPTFGKGYVRWPTPALETSTLYNVEIIRKVVSSAKGTVQDSFRDLDLNAGEGNSAQVREQKVARNTIGPNESVMYRLHFSTSRYRTYADKLADATIDDASEFSNAEWYPVIKAKGYEPFVLETKEPFSRADPLRFNAATGRTFTSVGSKSVQVSAVSQYVSSYNNSSGWDEYISYCSKSPDELNKITYTRYTKCYAMYVYRSLSWSGARDYRKIVRGHDNRYDDKYSNGGEFVSYRNKRAFVPPSMISYKRPGDDWNYRASDQLGYAPRISTAEIDEGVLDTYENGRMPFLYAMPIYAVEEHRKSKKYLRFVALVNKYRDAVGHSNGSLNLISYLDSRDTYDLSSLKSYIAEYDDNEIGSFWGGGVDEGSVTLDDVSITDEEVPDFLNSETDRVIFQQPLSYDEPGQDWVIITPPDGDPVQLMFEFSE